MNKLQLNQPGGAPLHTDDLTWQFESLISGIEALAGSINNNVTFKLSGITHSGSTVSAGWLWHNGNLYYHAQQSGVSYNAATQELGLSLKYIDDTTTTSQFADGTLKPLRKLRFVETVVVTLGQLGANLPFSQPINPVTKLSQDKKDKADFVSQAAFHTSSTVTAAYTVNMLSSSLKEVTIFAQIVSPCPSTILPVFIPQAYRPRHIAVNKIYTVADINLAYFVRLQVDKDGVVIVENSTGGTVEISLTYLVGMANAPES
jgi:hypothetical protein